jgi:hypothetical protein
MRDKINKLLQEIKILREEQNLTPISVATTVESTGKITSRYTVYYIRGALPKFSEDMIYQTNKLTELYKWLQKEKRSLKPLGGFR